jgi:hypothetical protein
VVVGDFDLAALYAARGARRREREISRTHTVVVRRAAAS